MSHGLTREQRLERAPIRSEIEALNAGFASLIDHERSDEVPARFTEDGSYGRENGGRSTGRDALWQVYAMRAACGERTVRHLFKYRDGEPIALPLGART